RRRAGAVAGTAAWRYAGGLPQARYRPSPPLPSPVAQRPSDRLLTGRLLVRVQSREQYETRLFPVGEGPPHPSPTATLEGRAPRTAPPPVTLEDRSDGTACPLPVPERIRRGHGRAESNRAETAESESSIALWHLVGAGNVRCDRQSTPALHLDESGSLQP